jgi:hypothetical protein
MRLNSVVRLALSMAMCLGVGHNRFACNKTTDINLVCCAHQAILDTTALGVSHRLDGPLHLDGRQLLEAVGE